MVGLPSVGQPFQAVQLTGWKACPTADGRSGWKGDRLESLSYGRWAFRLERGQAGKPVLQTDALQVAVGGAEDVVQLADDVVGQRID